MSLPINTASIPSLLRPGLATVFADYNVWPEQWMEIFSKHKSDKQVEYDVEMQLLPNAFFKPEGTTITYAGMAQGYQTPYKNITVGIGYIITHEAMMDNLYKAQFPMGTRAMRDSLSQFKNIQGANILNNAFSSSYLGADGVALASTAHPIANGTVANTFTIPTALNETSLENALTGIRLFRALSGLKVMLKPEKLIVPPQLEWTATRLLDSKFRTGTANNDINAIYNNKSIPDGYVINDFLTSPINWFVKTDEANGFKYFEREAVITDVMTDADTNNLKVRAFERYCFNWSNFRCVYAVTGL
jgi:hypothetical protein